MYKLKTIKKKALANSKYFLLDFTKNTLIAGCKKWSVSKILLLLEEKDKMTLYVPSGNNKKFDNTFNAVEAPMKLGGHTKKPKLFAIQNGDTLMPHISVTAICKFKKSKPFYGIAIIHDTDDGVFTQNTGTIILEYKEDYKAMLRSVYRQYRHYIRNISTIDTPKQIEDSNNSQGDAVWQI